MSKLIKSSQHDSHYDGQLIDTIIQFGGANEVKLFHNEWTLLMNIDVE